MKNQKQEALERRNNKLPKYARKVGDKDTEKETGADTEVF